MACPFRRSVRSSTLASSGGYGGLRLDEAKRLKALEQENTRLKRLVADQALDNAILKEVASGNF